MCVVSSTRYACLTFHLMSQLINSFLPALDILRETLDRLCTKNSAFQAARAEAANDMLKYMRVVFPLATKTQIVVLGNHGYTGQGEGSISVTNDQVFIGKENSPKCYTSLCLSDKI